MLAGGADSGLYRLDTATGRSRSGPGGNEFFYGDLRACPAGLLAVRGGEDGDELILVDHEGERVRVLAAPTGSWPGLSCGDSGP